jgi:hypothetical protein
LYAVIAARRVVVFALCACASACLCAACEDPFFAIYDGGAGAGGADAGLSDGSSHCIDLELHQYAYGVQALGSSALVPYGSDRVLFAQQVAGQSYYSGGLDGPRLESSITTPGFIPESAAARGDEIWLGGQDGTILHGRPMVGQPLIRASTVSAGESLRWISVSPPEMPLEIFALGDPGQKGRLYRYDGSKLTVRFDRQNRMPAADTSNGGVAWVAPGEAYFVPNAERCRSGPVCVMHATSSTVTEEVPETGYGITTVAEVAGFGTLAGDANGFLLSKRPEGWRPLEHVLIASGNRIRAIRAYHGGLLAVSDRQAVQYYGDIGLCLNPAQIRTVTSGIIPDITQALPFPGGIAVVGDAYGDMTGTLLVLREL